MNSNEWWLTSMDFLEVLAEAEGWRFYSLLSEGPEALIVYPGGTLLVTCGRPGEDDAKERKVLEAMGHRLQYFESKRGAVKIHDWIKAQVARRAADCDTE